MQEFERTRIERRMKELINLLDFEGCIKAFEKSDDLYLDSLIMDRMEELDQKRFYEYAENFF